MKGKGAAYCQGAKAHIYRSKAYAKARAKDIRRSGDPLRGPRGPIRPYQCEFCGLWHIGHKRRTP